MAGSVIAKRFTAEAKVLASIIAHNGADFTVGEAEHWVHRLDEAAHADFIDWNDR